MALSAPPPEPSRLQSPPGLARGSSGAAVPEAQQGAAWAPLGARPPCDPAEADLDPGKAEADLDPGKACRPEP